MKKLLLVFFTAFLLLSANARDTVRVKLEGTSEEMGSQLGKAHKDEIVKLTMLFKGLAMFYGKYSQAQLHEKSLKIAKHLAKEDLDEIRGIAKTAGVPYKDMLFFNFFYTLSNSRIGCRQFSTWGANTTDGKLIHSRNLDWVDYPGDPMKKMNTIVNYKGKGQEEYIILSWPGYTAALTGTNKNGLTIAFNQLPLRGDRNHISEPTFFTIKRALRTCKTLEEAVKLFQKALPMDSGSVMISDAKQKKAAVIEIIRGKVGVRYPSKGGLTISNANHATIEAGVAPRSATHAADRPVCTVARTFKGKFSPKSVQKLMAHGRVLQAEMNLLSVVFSPSDNKMWLSCGKKAAAKGPFKEYTLFKIDK